MKRSYFLIASLSLFSSSVFSQFDSTKKNEEAIDYSIFAAEVGKDYWIKANPKALRRIEFGSDYGLYGIQNTFVLTRDLKFTVTGWELKFGEKPILVVQFENGKSAYLPVSRVWKYTKKVFENIFDGTEDIDYIEYIFNSEPDAVLFAWRKHKEDEEKRAEAEHKKKGGVRIGMTKEQVLKSNWGKPESINKTTTMSGTREQWVYGLRNYLYFVNNVLTSIQN